MTRIHIDRKPRKRPRPQAEPLTLDPRDPDVVRAKELARATAGGARERKATRRTG